MSDPEPWPAAPTSVQDAAGAPCFGTFQGGLDLVDLSQLRGPHQPSRLGRVRSHKKWLYTFIATPEVAVVTAVADLTYTSNAFVLVLDYKSGSVLADVGVLGLPRPLVEVNDHPGMGAKAEFRRPGFRARVSRARTDDRYHGHLRVSLKAPFVGPQLALSWQLLTDDGPPPLSLIAPVEGGVVNVSQKWAGLLGSGVLEVDGRRFSLEDAVGGMDYTNGYLARETSWRWAFINGRCDDGSPFGINLVEGFNEGRDDVNENALWIDGMLIPLARARFVWDPADVLAPWRVHTTDGVLDLRFKPLAVHQEMRDLKLVRSSFKQPVGLWEGEVTLGKRTFTFKNAPGVSEDQSVLW